MLKENNMVKKLVTVFIIFLVAILSITVISKYATSPKVHSATIKTLDEKKLTALGLTASVTLTSTAIAAIPGDATTPVAEQISSLTKPLLAVVCAIYLEKFLLTTMGYISFDILIPISCGLLCVYIFCKKEVFKTLAIKLSVFAMAIFLIIPISVKVTNLMEATFDESISQTLETVDKISEEAEKNSDDENDANAFEKFLSALGDKVTDLGESAKNALSIFVDAIAVLIITTCIIPIVVIFFFIWIIKMIFGINVDTSQAKKRLLPKNAKE